MQKCTKICQDHHTCWLWPIMSAEGRLLVVMSNHLVGWIFIVVVAWKVQRWLQIKLESLIAAPITKTGRWNSGRRTLAGSYFCCAVLPNCHQEGGSLFFTVHFSYWVADIADQELEGKMWSAEIDQGLPRIWENSPSVGCDGIRHGGETYATRNPGFYDGAWWRNTRSFLLLTIYSLS